MNRIRNDGVQAIVAVFDRICLKHLDINNNSIDDNCAITITNNLWKNESLEALHIGWNSIGDKGCLALVTALERNSTICDLNSAVSRWVTTMVSAGGESEGTGYENPYVL